MNHPKENDYKSKVTIVDSDFDALQIRSMKIAKSLANNGYDVEFLVWDRERNRNNEKKEFNYKLNCFYYKPINNGFSGIILGYFLWWIYILFFSFRNNTDIYHCANIYNFFPIIFTKIIKKKNAILDILDFAADSYNWSNSVRNFLSNFENFCIKFSNGIIIVDDCRRTQIKSTYGKKIIVVMNCPENLIDDEDNSKKNNMVFTIYSGGWICETRGLRQICEAVEEFNDVKLIVAGFGPDEEKLSNIFKKQRNVEYKGLLSTTESLIMAQKADAVFAFYDPMIPINRLASPNKLFDAMMCRTPILANSEAIPVVNIINEEKCGLFVPYNDISKLKTAIEYLKSNPNILAEMGKNGRTAFEKKYNWKIMEKRLIKLYSKII